MAKKSEQERWAIWCECFDDVERELITLFHTRWMWHKILDVLEVSGVEQYVVVQNYLVRTYATTMCSAVRREVDPGTKTTSLARCLQRLIDWPDTMTRPRYVAGVLAASGGDWSEAYASAGYDWLAPNGGDTIDPATVQSFIAEIQLAAEPVKAYTNHIVAHRQSANKQIAPVTVTFREIDHAVDTLGDVAKKFHGLRYAGEMLVDFTPVVDLQFLTMFSEPWFPKGSMLPNHPSRSIFD